MLSRNNPTQLEETKVCRYVDGGGGGISHVLYEKITCVLMREVHSFIYVLVYLSTKANTDQKKSHTILQHSSEINLEEGSAE